MLTHFDPHLRHTPDCSDLNFSGGKFAFTGSCALAPAFAAPIDFPDVLALDRPGTYLEHARRCGMLAPRFSRSGASASILAILSRGSEGASERGKRWKDEGAGGVLPDDKRRPR